MKRTKIIKQSIALLTVIAIIMSFGISFSAYSYTDTDNIISTSAPVIAESSPRNNLISDYSLAKERNISSSIIDNTEVTLIVELEDSESLLSESFRETIKQQILTLITEAIPDAEPLFEFDFEYIFDGFTVKCEQRFLEDIKALSGVKSVTVSKEYKLLNSEECSYSGECSTLSYSSSAVSMGISQFDDINYHGEGMLIAIVDTGIMYDHPAVQYYDAYKDVDEWISVDEIANRIDTSSLAAESILGKQLCSDDYYRNGGKIAFSFDYGDYDTDASCWDETYEASDEPYHGLHVAGIAAGYEDAEGEENDFYGIAPYAQLAVMKVMDKTGSLSDLAIYNAFEDCCKLKVDVVNASFGATLGGYTDNDDALFNAALSNMAELGITFTVSAGNAEYTSRNSTKETSYPKAENPEHNTIGSPSSYPTALSVASSTTYCSTNKISVTSNGNITDFPVYYDNGNSFTNLTGSYGYAMCGNATDEEIKNVDVKGKIAVISKVQNTTVAMLKGNGAVGMIVCGNLLIGTLEIPEVSIEEKAYNILAETLANDPDAKISCSSGYSMSGFTSWGSLSDLRLKPEITAPGSAIYSSWYTFSNKPYQPCYAYLSGTSMASPNTAGAITLVKQYLKENISGITAVELNSIATNTLISTAQPINDINDIPYSPRQQGSGLINIKSALSTPAYLSTSIDDEYDTDRPIINLFDDPEKTGKFSIKFNVTNISSDELTYNIYLDALMPQTEEDSEGTLRYNGHDEFIEQNKYVTRITVASGETESVTIEYTIPQEVQNKMTELFKNGCYFEGYVKLTNENDESNVLSAPFLGFYGDWTDAPIFDTSSYDEEAYESDYDLKFGIEEVYSYYNYVKSKTFGGTLYSLIDEYNGMALGSNYWAELINLDYNSMYTALTIVLNATEEEAKTALKSGDYKALYDKFLEYLYYGNVFENDEDKEQALFELLQGLSSDCPDSIEEIENNDDIECEKTADKLIFLVLCACGLSEKEAYILVNNEEYPFVYYDYTKQSSHIAISPNDDGIFDTMYYAVPILLRYPKEVTMTVSSKSSSKYSFIKRFSTYYSSKISYPGATIEQVYIDQNTSETYSYFINGVDWGEWKATNYWGTKVANNTLCDITFTAKINYASDKTVDDSWSLPIYVDTESPKISNIKEEKNEGQLFLTADISDNHYLAYSEFYMGIYNTEEQRFTKTICEDYPLYFGNEKDINVKYDISECNNVQLGENEIIAFYFYACDYAMNEYESNLYEFVYTYDYEKTLEIGKTLDAKEIISADDLTAISFESSDTQIATVDSEGIIKGIGKGTAVITATLTTGDLAQITVNVIPTTIVHEGTVTVKRRKTVTLPLTLSGKVSKMTSSNSLVALPLGNGKVFGIFTGTSTVTVYYSDGSTEIFKVQVVK